jgi:hypothetical protein
MAEDEVPPVAVMDHNVAVAPFGDVRRVAESTKSRRERASWAASASSSMSRTAFPRSHHLAQPAAASAEVGSPRPT